MGDLHIRHNKTVLLNFALIHFDEIIMKIS